jgi:hypothetical protein
MATCSKRSSVSGYLRTMGTSAAACGFGLARPFSHFPRVRSLIRTLRAKPPLNSVASCVCRESTLCPP